VSATRGLVVSEVSKWYGATRALTNVTLEIPEGRVVALIGHNGAGKSTLLRALSGAETPDEGQILINGRHFHFSSPADATICGIACVYQELSLINELTIAENLFLGAEKFAGAMLDRRAMNVEADAVCAEYGLPATATDLVSSLSVAQRQLLEVARAIHRDARYLLLDEPTTALEQSQIDNLLEIIKRVSRERNIGILLIDHKLDEVYAVADRIVGLSNGAIVFAGEADGLPREKVVEAIVGAGREIAEGAARDGKHVKAPMQPRRTETVFESRAIAGNGLNGVSMQVAAGEIMGVYGLVGSGRSRFVRTIYGLEPIESGEMTLKGASYRPGRPVGAIIRGVAFLSEERKFDGFIPQMSSTDNIVLPVLDRYRSAGFLNWPRLRRAAHRALSGIPIRGDVGKPITALSGGNQQKALFARAVLQSPNLLLLDEPTKGVDIGAKSEIYHIIRGLAGEGRSVIVISSEEEELLEICDRIVVFRNGGCDGQVVPEDDFTIAGLRRRAWSDA
jgi:ABC-type sugar transport system ATPase subunit